MFAFCGTELVSAGWVLFTVSGGCIFLFGISCSMLVGLFLYALWELAGWTACRGRFVLR